MRAECGRAIVQANRSGPSETASSRVRTYDPGAGDDHEVTFTLSGPQALGYLSKRQPPIADLLPRHPKVQRGRAEEARLPLITERRGFKSRRLGNQA